MNSYKFYLSFENSLCDDYITEKFWKLYRPETLFEVNILPITRGATEEQFSKVAFPNSLINAYNFETAQQLGSYLRSLNQNDTAYLEYFKWKKGLFEKLEVNINDDKVNEKDITKEKEDIRLNIINWEKN